MSNSEKNIPAAVKSYIEMVKKNDPQANIEEIEELLCRDEVYVLLDFLLHTLSQKKKPTLMEELSNYLIEELEFTTITRRALSRSEYEIKTAADLLSLGEDKLNSIPGFGPRCMSEVKTKLHLMMKEYHENN